MKKIVKMSLVAAVAVAGLTAANAQPLEEAIKNVEVSGTVVYRYNDTRNETPAGVKTTNRDNNNYKIGLNLSSKVNDDVKLNTRFLVADDDGGFAALDSSSDGDANVDAMLSNVYFGYTGIANTTVNVGKQGLTTPWTTAIDSDGNEQTGTGILALSTWGPVTVAGAYFNQTNLGTAPALRASAAKATPLFAGYEDIATLGVIGNVGPVTLDAWYLDAQDLFDTYTVGAKADFDVSGVKLGADVRYTALDQDAVTTDDNMLKATLTAKVGMFNALYAYATTDKEGGIVSLDNDAVTDIQGWSISASGLTDADYHQFVLGAQVLDTVHVSGNFVTVDYNANGAIGATADDSREELYAQVVYNMSKNLSTYVRFGTEETKVDNAKTTEADYKGRLQVQYSF